MKRILDACCGSRMFWFDKSNQDVVFMDKRQLQTNLCDGRKLEVNPNIVADFRNMPFDDESFYMVVFDPLHLIRGGDKSWLVQKYVRLNETWPEDLKQGFDECMRVLKPNGTLIFKWNEEQIKLSEVLKCFSQKPLLGNKRSKTHWLVFMKGADE
ncbi:methyltransferase domain-containing protein [Staphylococcus pseudintermedius]|nr:methyltransferase domain-containing protein [Staphylococcus pseudintermedius]